MVRSSEQDDIHNGGDMVMSYLYPPFYKPEDGAPLVPFEGDVDYPFEDISSGGDENKIRGNWQSKADYLLSLMGFAVSIRNFWMFPYHLAVHGGVAFLIPYVTMLVLVAIPLFLMEASLGQFASLGCVTVWKVCPMFKGIGISSLVLCCVIAIYHNMVSAWALYYLVTSVHAAWTSATCLGEDCEFGRGSANETNVTMFATVLLNSSNIAARKVAELERRYHYDVLEISEGIGHIAGIRWQLALALLVAWFLVFICLFKSIKSSGKVVYVIVPVPYIVMLVLLARALTLEGAVDAVLDLAAPDWSKLAVPEVGFVMLVLLARALTLEGAVDAVLDLAAPDWSKLAVPEVGFVMLVLLARALTLEGAVDAVLDLAAPDWSKLAVPEVGFVMLVLLARALTLEGAVDAVLDLAAPDWSKLAVPEVGFVMLVLLARALTLEGAVDAVLDLAAPA